MVLQSGVKGSTGSLRGIRRSAAAHMSKFSVQTVEPSNRPSPDLLKTKDTELIVSVKKTKALQPNDELPIKSVASFDDLMMMMVLPTASVEQVTPQVK